MKKRFITAGPDFFTYNIIVIVCPFDILPGFVFTWGMYTRMGEVNRRS